MDKMQEAGNQTQETKQENMHCFAYQIRYYETNEEDKKWSELDGVFRSVNSHRGNDQFDKSN